MSKGPQKIAMASINHDLMGGLGDNVARKQIKVDSSRQTNISKIRQRKAKVRRKPKELKSEKIIAIF